MRDCPDHGKPGQPDAQNAFLYIVSVVSEYPLLPLAAIHDRGGSRTLGGAKSSAIMKKARSGDRPRVWVAGRSGPRPPVR